MDSLELKNLVRSYLASDEDIYWCDKPVKKFTLSPGGSFRTIFGIIWIAFSIFWTVMAASMGAPVFYYAFGIGFVLIGFIMFFIVPLVLLNRRSNCIYAITDRRILQVSVGSSRRILEYKYADIDSIYVKSSKDGTGSIYFSLISRRYRMQNSSYSGSVYSCGIMGIKDPEKVYRIISEQMASVRRDAL